MGRRQLGDLALRLGELRRDEVVEPLLEGLARPVPHGDEVGDLVERAAEALNPLASAISPIV